MDHCSHEVVKAKAVLYFLIHFYYYYLIVVKAVFHTHFWKKRSHFDA